jgi:CTP synthase (UTP-ammonia lyase)
MVPAEISSIKIAIIGDYNFTFNTHHAVNLAIDHASHFLEIEIDNKLNYTSMKMI